MMIRQSLIDNYFKSKASTVSPKEIRPTMNDDKPKKHKLSLIKPATPTKSPRKGNENKNVRNISNFSSDEDDIWENTPRLQVPCIDLTQGSNDGDDESDCSANTVIHSPTKTITTPRQVLAPQTPPKTKITSPQSVNKDNNMQPFKSPHSTPNHFQPTVKEEQSSETPQKNIVSLDVQRTDTAQKTPIHILTPQKSRETPHSQSSRSYNSPQSRDKFFSPTKKRVVKRTPPKVKRSLGMEMSRSLSSRILFEDDLLAHASEGMDDKTKFLLEIINRCLNEPSIMDLLSVDAQTLLANCLQVVKPGMRLVCRLYWRKEGWYTHKQVSEICTEKKNTIEQEAILEMMTSLIQKGLIEQANMHNMNFNDYMEILKRDDLKDICKDLKLKMNSKQDAKAALEAYSKSKQNISNYFKGCTTSNSKRLFQMMIAKAGPCYRLSELARNTLYRLYILMYLGVDYSIIREKKLEVVLIYDKINKEKYPIDKEMPLDNASVVFSDKDEFERYITAHNIYEDFLTLSDVTQKCKVVQQVYNLYKDISKEKMERYKSLPPWLHRYTPANIYVKILEAGIQDLKRDKQGGHYLLALNILSSLINQTTFRQHKKANWYDEKALILHSCLSRYDEAAEVLLDGFKSSMSEEAKDCMRQRAKRLAKQKNITLSEHLKKELLEYGDKDTLLETNLQGRHVHKQPMDRISNRGKIKFDVRTPDGGRTMLEAEDYCIAEYVSSGEFTHGEHWEGRMVTSLFFLLFWDIIYTKPRNVRGVFLSHYQQHPLDLYTDSFYANRKEIIDDWLEVIEGASEEKLLRMMQETWDSRPEYEISGLSRGAMSWEKLSAAARCLGGRAAAALCRRLARRYRHAHSGFPDLTLWNTHTKRIKFVEVKTDSDKPSIKQLQWMRYLQQHGLEAEFCYVGVHTTRQRARVHKDVKTPVKAEL